LIGGAGSVRTPRGGNSVRREDAAYTVDVSPCAEPAARDVIAGLDEPRAQWRIGAQTCDRGRKRVGAIGLAQQAVHAIVDDFRHPARPHRHDWPPREHAFDDDTAKRLRRNGGMRNDIDRTHTGGHIVAEPKKMYA